MRYKVPQNIDLEDKVIGPLTLKQFFYLLGGGMLDYIIYHSISGFFGWILIFIISGIALAFAFVKIQEQDFGYFVMAMFNFTIKPKIYFWKKETRLEEIPKTPDEEGEEEDSLSRDPEEVRSRLQTLASVVENKGWKSKEKGTRVTSQEETETELEEVAERQTSLEDPLAELD